MPTSMCVYDEATHACAACGIAYGRVVAARNCRAGASDVSRLVDLQCAPGAELHFILRDWLGIEPTPTCPCRSMAAKMDRLGPDWCESDEGMGEILGVMRTEHEKRRAEGTTILPWTDFGARQLVLLACRRARAKAAG